MREAREKGQAHPEAGRYASEQPPWIGWRKSRTGRAKEVRQSKDHVSVERHDFLCSFTDFDRFAETVRAHRCIKNQQHWVLDVPFSKDVNHSRTDHSAENLVLVRRTAMSLLC